MPVEDAIISRTTEDPDAAEQDAAQFEPGELVAFEATNDRVEIEDDPDHSADGGDGFTKEQKEHCLKRLASRASQRDITSRRLQVRDAWKARYFYRGSQHLLAGKNGAWVLPSNVLVGGASFDDHSDETNIYLAFADTIVAALTAGNPSVRFEAQNPANAGEVNAAENADKARLLIERDNNMIVLQEDMARFLWTDGLSAVYTRHILDGQRFGYQDPEVTPEQEAISYLPETGGQGPPPNPTEAAAGRWMPQGPARGREVIRAFGTLEVKVPIQAREQADYAYLQFSEECDVTTVKAAYPDKADDIAPNTASTAESDYERLARTSVMMGMRPSNLTSDQMTYNTTVQKTWVRPSFFFEEHDDRMRAWLFENFPKGAMIVIAGTVFCEARNESMDCCWTVVQARPGDGQHRPALGSPLIPLQEKLNDCMDLTHESFMHLIPRIFVDIEEADLQSLSDTKREPGQYIKMKRKGDKDLAGNFFAEPAIQLAEGLLVYIEKLFGEFAQFLCGAFPALFGGNTGSNDTAQGIASQRDQALGRIGLTWRAIKAAYASIIRQAVMAAGEHRQEPMTGTIPTKGGADTKLTIDPNDLKGNILCFPDTDENFPESWVAQRAIWMQLLEQAKSNPILGAILGTPRNLAVAKDKIGVPDVSIEGAASSTKQAGEIMLLMQSPPQPNPELIKAQQAAAMAAASGDPAAGLEAQQALQQTPPLVSTVPIGKFDNHQLEMQEIETWANSPEGIKAQSTQPQNFQNVATHYDEHAKALAEKQAQNPQGPQEKPPSESLSLNFKDLPIDGQVQAAAKYGIKLDPAQLQAQELADKAAKAQETRARFAGQQEGQPTVQ